MSIYFVGVQSIGGTMDWMATSRAAPRRHGL
jgi:hypothetical protein